MIFFLFPFFLYRAEYKTNKTTTVNTHQQQKRNQQETKKRISILGMIYNFQTTKQLIKKKKNWQNKTKRFSAVHV